MNIKTQYFADEVLKYQITFTEKKISCCCREISCFKRNVKKNWNEVIKTFIVGILYFYGIHIKFPIKIAKISWIKRTHVWHTFGQYLKSKMFQCATILLLLVPMSDDDYEIIMVSWKESYVKEKQDVWKTLAHHCHYYIWKWMMQQS